MSKPRPKDIKDAVDRARAPGHAGDTQREPLAGTARRADGDATGDVSAGNPQVETDHLHALMPDAANDNVRRDHFQVDRDALADIMPAANDEDR